MAFLLNFVSVSIDEPEIAPLVLIMLLPFIVILVRDALSRRRKYFVKKVDFIHWVSSCCPGLDSQTSGVGHMSKVKHSAKFSMASKA